MVLNGEQPPSDLNLNGQLSAFFKSNGLPNQFMVLPLIAKQYYHKEAGILSWCSCISVLCLIVSSLLHYFTCEWIQNPVVRCMLAYLSVVLRIVAATFLLVFLDPVRHLVVILPLSLLALVLLGYFFWRTFISHKQPGKNWGQHEAELKLRFDLSSQVVNNFGFPGLLGTVLGYVKGSSSNHQLSAGRGYMAPDSFLSYSILLGLLVQLFSTAPSYIWTVETRRRMAKVYLRIVAYASLMFLVLGSVMAAEEILREWVFIACFIVVIIHVLCFWYEIESDDGPSSYWETITRREEDQDDKAAQFVRAFITPAFAALMASNSRYSIETGSIAVLSWSFKFAVLSVLCGILSCAARMVFISEIPEMRRKAFPKKVWNWSMFATVPITILLVARVWYMYPDEIKNIF